jgi:lipopolysaccharide biosynthesis regulator YciM
MAHVLAYVLVGIGALVLGALLGRYYVPDIRQVKRAARQGKAYARALTYVLGEDHERAATELGKVVEEDVSDVEPYFAIGCLFRVKGEHERAVRVHQAVILRRDADDDTRQRARFELGLDFLAAGFRRHAARAFAEILQHDGHRAGALKALWRLHEEDGELADALSAYRQMCTAEGRAPDRRTEAHLLAEAAAAEARGGALEAARQRLLEADGLDPDNPHVLATFAQLERARGEAAEAATLWARALRSAPDLAPWIYPRLEEAFFETGRSAEVAELLDGLLATRATIPLRLSRARLTAARDPAAATAELRELLAEAPALLPAREELGRLLLQHGTPDAVRAEYEALLESLKRLGRGYRCGACGRAMADLFWRCPGCGEWGTVRLVWGRREGEGAAPGPLAGVGVATVAPLPAAPPRRELPEATAAAPGDAGAAEAGTTTQKIDPATEA